MTANRAKAVTNTDSCPLMVLGAPDEEPVGVGERGDADEEDEALELLDDEPKSEPEDMEDANTEAKLLAETEEEGAVGVGLGVLEAEWEADAEELGVETGLEPEL